MALMTGNEYRDSLRDGREVWADGERVTDVPSHPAFSVAFEDPATRHWLEKYYTVNECWSAEDRRRLLAFSRDLVNSSYSGRRLTFELFAQSPPFAHLNAVYDNFDPSAALDLVQRAAGLSERVMEQ